jgi:hypothetical protein
MPVFLTPMTTKSRQPDPSHAQQRNASRDVRVTFPTPEETQSVGAAEGCDLLILIPSNLSDISFNTPGCP